MVNAEVLLSSFHVILFDAISAAVRVLSCISDPSIVPSCILSPLMLVILAPFQIKLPLVHTLSHSDTLGTQFSTQEI